MYVGRVALSRIAGWHDEVELFPFAYRRPDTAAVIEIVSVCVDRWALTDGTGRARRLCRPLAVQCLEVGDEP